MIHFVYLSSEIRQINDTDGDQYEGITRNLPATLVSQEEVYYGGAFNIASKTLFDPVDGKGTKLFTIILKVSLFEYIYVIFIFDRLPVLDIDASTWSYE